MVRRISHGTDDVDVGWFCWFGWGGIRMCVRGRQPPSVLAVLFPPLPRIPLSPTSWCVCDLTGIPCWMFWCLWVTVHMGWCFVVFVDAEMTKNKYLGLVRIHTSVCQSSCELWYLDNDDDIWRNGRSHKDETQDKARSQGIWGCWQSVNKDQGRWLHGNQVNFIILTRRTYALAN